MPALGQFLGSPSGLSGPVITKLTQAWQEPEPDTDQVRLPGDAAQREFGAAGVGEQLRVELGGGQRPV